MNTPRRAEKDAFVCGVCQRSVSRELEVSVAEIGRDVQGRRDGRS
jgi:hypothetical protein